MKIIFRIFFAAALLPLAACNQKSADNEQEIERRVQERLADQQRAEKEQALADKEKSLEAREKALADRQNAPASSAAREEADSAVADDVGTNTGKDYTLFYNALEPQGDWIDTDRYGYVWRPNVEDRDPEWAPYREGHWAYTEEGWTWVSDEPFGWAVYHYGRWARIPRYGWVWVPGSTWAPAWVSWRHGGDYVGWAPLPPEARFRRGGFSGEVDVRFGIGADSYLFVNIGNFCAPRVSRVVVPRQQNTTIIQSTTNITNITNKNTTIINRGPNIQLIQAKSQQPVQKLTIVKNTSVEKPAPAAVQNNQLVVSAPVLKKAAAPATPARVKERITNVKAEHLQNAALPSAAQPKVTATPAANLPISTVNTMPTPKFDNEATKRAGERLLQAERQAREQAEKERAEQQKKAAEAEQQRLKMEQANEAQKLQMEKLRAERETAQRAAEEKKMKAQEAQKERKPAEIPAQAATPAPQRAPKAKGKSTPTPAPQP